MFPLIIPFMLCGNFSSLFKTVRETENAREPHARYMIQRVFIIICGRP